MTTENRDLEILARQIGNLGIEVSKSEDGLLTVCSTSEPFFCFDGHSEDELRGLVAGTLRSYAKHFFNIDATVSTESTPIEEIIPVERSTPISRLKPAFALAA